MTVCFSCYKSHLHILKHTQSESTDEELNELLKEIKHTIIKPEQIKSIEDAISMAMSMTTVYVGEALLQQEGLLLPNVHNFFLGVCPSISQRTGCQCKMGTQETINRPNYMEEHQ